MKENTRLNPDIKKPQGPQPSLSPRDIGATMLALLRRSLLNILQLAGHAALLMLMALTLGLILGLLFGVSSHFVEDLAFLARFALDRWMQIVTVVLMIVSALQVATGADAGSR
jgi:hypothetical protein